MNILLKQCWEHNWHVWVCFQHQYVHHVSLRLYLLKHKKQPFFAFFWKNSSKFDTFKNQVAFFWPGSLTLVQLTSITHSKMHLGFEKWRVIFFSEFVQTLLVYSNTWSYTYWLKIHRLRVYMIKDDWEKLNLILFSLA